MSEGTPRGGQSAWVVNWRNQQQRKNKSWENDGWLHVQGPTVTLYNEEGNKMGQKNFTRPLVEGQELSIAGKEIRVDDAILVRDLWAAIKGEGSSRGTPAPISRPGFFSHSTPQPQTNAYRSPAPNPLLSRSTALKPSSVNRPRSSLANNDVFRADTPEVDDFPDSGFGEAPQSMNDTPGGGGGGGGSDKKWFNPKDHFQKPFKFPTPVRRTSPALEYGPSKVVDKGKRSRMQDQAEDGVGDSDEEAVEEERRREESNAKRDKAKGKSSRADEMARMVIERNNRNKGKAAASRDQDEEEEGNGEERENSPPQSSPQQERERDEPTPPKKRKVDNESQAVPRKPRVSAADLALSRSMSGGKSSTSSNRSSTSTDKQKPPSSRAAIQVRPPPPSSTVGSSDHEQGQSSRVKPEPIEDEELDSTLLLGSEYRDALGLGEEEEGMDWDEGDDLNEEGSLAGSVSERDASDSERSQGSVEEVREERVRKAVGSIGEEKKIRYFSCQWRKQTTKKNATWEGDGFLKIDKSGRATLKDSESGKEIGSAPLSKQASLEEDSVIKIGNKEVEISTPSDRQAWEGDDYDEDSVSTATVSSSRFNPPSSSRSVKPIVPRSSSAVSAAPRSSAVAKSFAVPGLVKPTGIKSNSFYNNPTIDTTNNKKPSALFDPTIEGAVVMKRPDREHSDDYNKKGHPIVDVVVDPLIGDKLRPHQKEGVRFMYECVMGMSTKGQGCILADEMGLGKTIQSIALIWTLLKQNPYHSPTYVRTGVIERAMIVCPVTLIKNWAAEIKKWLGRDSVRIMVADQPSSVKTFANSRTYQILIVGYEKLTSAIETVKYAQPPVGLIICDEGHRLKSANTKTAKAIQTLSCQRRVILSGTPIQNNLGEFFAMMDFVNPGLLKDAAYFKKNYEQPILRSRELKASAKDKKAGKEAAESLSEIQRNFVLRRTSDLLQRHLPPKSEFTVFVVPTQLEIDIYGQVLASSAVRSLLSGSGKTEQLSLLMMLRKCANTPGLLMKHATEDKREESIFQSNLTDLFPSDLAWTDFALSAKLSTLAAMLRKLRQESDEKIVVVSNFTSTLDIIEKYCRKQKFPYCRLDGKTPQNDRISMVNGFNRGTKNSHFIFLLSSKSGGTGLNIIGASRLVLLDSEWNPSTDLQAMARIHRDGQTRPCFIYRFLTSGTIDEKIYQRQITKLALSGSVMEEDSTSASKKGDAFTMDDLKNIFRLHHDTACQTHDLIECKCHRGENEPESQPSQEAQDDSDDSDDERSGSEGLGGFVPASQWEGEPVDKKALKKAHRNLSLLKTWNHYDCSRAETVLAIEDKLLQMMIYELAEHNSEEREVRPFSMLSEEEQGEYARGERVPIKGGQIGWVFEKKKDEKKSDEEGEDEGEEED